MFYISPLHELTAYQALPISLSHIFTGCHFWQDWHGLLKVVSSSVCCIIWNKIIFVWFYRRILNINPLNLKHLIRRLKWDRTYHAIRIWKYMLCPKYLIRSKSLVGPFLGIWNDLYNTVVCKLKLIAKKLAFLCHQHNYNKL